MDIHEYITPEGLYNFQITNRTLFKHILHILSTQSDYISGMEGEMFYVKNQKNCGISDGENLNMINGLLDLSVLGFINPSRKGICTPITSSVYTFPENIEV